MGSERRLGRGARVTLGRAMSERVLIAMSGGVDSSVAAARLCAQGFVDEDEPTGDEGDAAERGDSA